MVQNILEADLQIPSKNITIFLGTDFLSLQNTIKDENPDKKRIFDLYQTWTDHPQVITLAKMLNTSNFENNELIILDLLLFAKSDIFFRHPGSTFSSTTMLWAKSLTPHQLIYPNPLATFA